MSEDTNTENCEEVVAGVEVKEKFTKTPRTPRTPMPSTTHKAFLTALPNKGRVMVR